MSEHYLWRTVRRHLGPYLDLVRVENRADPGSGDLHWTGLGASGWMELKHLDGWPKREGTSVVVRRLTLNQVTWLEHRIAIHERAHVLLRVSGEGYALLRPSVVRALYERQLNRAALIMSADIWATGRFPKEAILRALTGRSSPAKPLTGPGERGGARPVGVRGLG